MGILSDINRFVKKAQLIMPQVHSPEVYQQGAKNIANAVKKVPNYAWGTIGAGAGLLKSIADRKWTIPLATMSPISPVTNVGEDRPDGSWVDYLRSGWNTGYNHGDLAAAGMIEGAANTIPFAKFEAPSRLADLVQNDKIEKGMDPEDSLYIRGGSGIAGSIAASIPVFGIAGKGVKAVEKAIKASRIAKSAPRLVGIASKIPSYALGLEMYGGEDFENAAKGLWDSWKDGYTEEPGIENGLPSWQSYLSPRNTVDNESIKIN